jgi:peptide/nickel transport system substrate-binding protein
MPAPKPIQLLLTRRAVLSRVSLALGGGAVASLVSACGPTAVATPTLAPTAPPAAAKPATAAAAPTTAPAAPTTIAAAAAPKPTTAAAASGATGGTLRLLMWQGPTILNGHLSQGTKDYIAARFCCEPLLTVNAEGVFAPVLAAEVPSKDNGGLGTDGKTVTYKLRQGVKWADGEPFTADDVVFTYQFITNPETAAVTIANYSDLQSVEAVDPQTVRLTFKQATGAWYVPFTGATGLVLPKHVLGANMGAAARDAGFNLKAFGTGPYMTQEFKPGDVLTLVANPNFRDPGKPFFSQVEIKGGGDAVSAARAVMQTGEYDYAWNLQVEAQVLNQLLQSGKGELVTSIGGGVEQVFFNQADPTQEVDGERSSPNSKHPFLTDQRVRQAMALAIDRQSIAKQLYGPTGDATSNFLTIPANLESKNTKVEYDVDKANQILDDAGYARGSDGVRLTPGGVRMHVVFQTSTNSLRQKEQDLIKDGWQKIGIETELKSVDASIYFSSDAGNPDTYAHFTTDAEMFTSSPDTPSPLLFMKRFYGRDPGTDFAQKSNNWSAPNMSKWSNDEYNQLFDAVKAETDVSKAATLWQKMNDVAVNAYIVVPLVARKGTDAKIKGLDGPNPGPFDYFSWNIADWRK